MLRYAKMYRFYERGLIGLALLLVAYLSWVSFERWRMYDAVESSLKNNRLLFFVYKNMAKERDAAVMQSTSQTTFNQKFSNLQPFYRETDNAIDSWHTFLLHLPQHIAFRDHNFRLVNKLDRLENDRYHVLHDHVEFDEVFFDVYMQSYLDPIMQLMHTIQAYYGSDGTLNNLVGIALKHQAQYALLVLESGFFSYYIQTNKIPDAPIVRKYHHEVSTLISLSGYKGGDIALGATTTQDTAIEQLKRSILHPQSSTSKRPKDRSLRQWVNIYSKEINKAQHQLSRAWDALFEHTQTKKNEILIGAGFYLLFFIAIVLFVYIWHQRASSLTSHIQEIGQGVIKALASLEGAVLSPETICKKQRLSQHISKIIQDAINYKKAATQAKQSKKFFMTHVANEYIAPLDGITGFSRLLENTPLQAEQKRTIDLISQSAEELSFKLKNIMNLIQIETGNIEIDSKPVDLFARSEEIIKRMSLYIQKRGVKTSVYIDPSIPFRLHIDDMVFEDIVIALITFVAQHADISKQISISLTHNEVENFTHRITFQINAPVISRIFDGAKEIIQEQTHSLSEVPKDYIELFVAKEFIQAMDETLQIDRGQNGEMILQFDLLLQSPIDTKQSRYQETKVQKVFYFSTKAQDNPNHLALLKYFDYLQLELTQTNDPLQLHEIADQEQIDFDQFWFDCDETYLKEIKTLSSKLSSNRIVLLYEKTPITSSENYLLLQKPVFFSDIIRTLNAVYEQTDIHRFFKETYQNVRALIAEDNVVNQKLLKTILKNKGFEVDVVNNGLEALQHIEQQSYDIIFMDIQMPIMDGIEATRKIVQYEQAQNKPHTPIVILSGNIVQNVITQLSQYGIDAYISKPVQIPQLQQILETYLSHKHSQKPDPSATAEQTEKNKLILVAASNHIERQIISKMLDKLQLDYHILEKKSQVGAKLARGNYDIVITDLIIDDAYKNNSMLILSTDTDIQTLEHSITAFRNQHDRTKDQEAVEIEGVMDDI